MNDNFPDDVTQDQIDGVFGFDTEDWIEMQRVYLTCPHCRKKTGWYGFNEYNENELGIIDCDWCDTWFIAKWWISKGEIKTKVYGQDDILNIMQEEDV